MKRWMLIAIAILMASTFFFAACAGDDDDDGDSSAEDNQNDDDVNTDYDYTIVDTDQTTCYGSNSAISCGSLFSGQDAQYDGTQPSYQDNGDGTVTDLRTGLMWQQDPGEKVSYNEAVAGAASLSLAGYDDWRLPTIKELYSLMNFTGIDPNVESTDASGLTPFIDTDYFVFSYGDTTIGDRIIDSQWATSSIYKGTVMDGQECFFGVNFADGRIKCYPTSNKEYYVIYVRNAEDYGQNDFADNGDGTVDDAATGLMWQQGDSGEGMVWEDALAYCETSTLAGYDDWRLPNAKELQSIVDYSRSPDATDSAAIDELFDASQIVNEAGDADWAFYWSGTTHDGTSSGGARAAYVAFGRALGYMNGQWMDVHGAGAQRSDPKAGDPDDYPQGNGPQGDAIRVYNYVRCVRGGVATPDNGDDVTVDDDEVSDDDAVSDDDTAPPAPPEEAVEACEGLTEGDECSFVAPEGTITGTCQTIGDVLACVP